MARARAEAVLSLNTAQAERDATRFADNLKAALTADVVMGAVDLLAEGLKKAFEVAWDIAKTFFEDINEKSAKFGFHTSKLAESYGKLAESVGDALAENEKFQSAVDAVNARIIALSEYMGTGEGRQLVDAWFSVMLGGLAGIIRGTEHIVGGIQSIGTTLSALAGPFKPIASLAGFMWKAFTGTWDAIFKIGTIIGKLTDPVVKFLGRARDAALEFLPGQGGMFQDIKALKSAIDDLAAPDPDAAGASAKSATDKWRAEARDLAKDLDAIVANSTGMSALFKPSKTKTKTTKDIDADRDMSDAAHQMLAEGEMLAAIDQELMDKEAARELAHQERMRDLRDKRRLEELDWDEQMRRDREAAQLEQQKTWEQFYTGIATTFSVGLGDLAAAIATNQVGDSLGLLFADLLDETGNFLITQGLASEVAASLMSLFGIPGVGLAAVAAGLAMRAAAGVARSQLSASMTDPSARAAGGGFGAPRGGVTAPPNWGPPGTGAPGSTTYNLNLGRGFVFGTPRQLARELQSTLREGESLAGT